jgi:hypothetical protein
MRSGLNDKEISAFVLLAWLLSIKPKVKTSDNTMIVKKILLIISGALLDVIIENH